MRAPSKPVPTPTESANSDPTASPALLETAVSPTRAARVTDVNGIAATKKRKNPV